MQLLKNNTVRSSVHFSKVPPRVTSGKATVHYHSQDLDKLHQSYLYFPVLLVAYACLVLCNFITYLESQGRGSLVGCRLWGRTESDTTETT